MNKTITECFKDYYDKDFFVHHDKDYCKDPTNPLDIPKAVICG